MPPDGPQFDLDRRAALTGAGALALARPAARPSTDAQFAELEHRLQGGRLGVFAIRHGQWAAVGYRGLERFAMCSTFKASLAAMVLQRVDQGQERLDRVVRITKSDILSHSPVTEKHVGDGLPVGEMCKAIVQVSDNGGANLLLASVGGPAALTRFWRSIGDQETRLDRTELSLNEARPGDPRDTTTPNAMARDLDRFLYGKVLRPASQRLLADWMAGTTTGLARIRAGAPSGWRVGDKTGAGQRNSSNDIAYLVPPKGEPILLAIYTTGGALADQAREAVIADAARLALSSLGGAHG